jgi:ribosome-binding protein aMBF1 (putative translation factor)
MTLDMLRRCDFCGRAANGESPDTVMLYSCGCDVCNECTRSHRHRKYTLYCANADIGRPSSGGQKAWPGSK